MHELEQATIDQVPKEVDLKSTATKEASEEETVETHTQQIDVFRCFKTQEAPSTLQMVVTDHLGRDHCRQLIVGFVTPLPWQ